VIDLLQEAGLPVIRPGLAHGTVTTRVGTASYQITTLRQDVETYGRCADVRFTDS